MEKLSRAVATAVGDIEGRHGPYGRQGVKTDSNW
jgi:hypothetical protein